MAAPDADTQLRIAPAVAKAMRTTIRQAGGREVCFACTVDAQGTVTGARAVARGTADQVLALPGVVQRGEMLVHNHPSGWLEPSKADMAIAARLHDDGIGCGIVDNDVTDLYVVTEVPRQKQVVAVDPDALDADFGLGGRLSRGFAQYEPREGQRAMAREIAATYAEGGVALLEAGTGIGKSMAYLVPALRWSAANTERTIVSTATITLQEQLVRKDLPLLARVLDDQPVRYALLKGWRNYLCLARLESAKAQGRSLFEAKQETELAQLAEWAAVTTDGSLADLPTPPTPEVWDEVVAEGDLCTRMKCPHFEKCFVFRARREAAQADVIVVNHSLLLADLAVRRQTGNWGEAAVLPAYKHLVVDEGHHLEDAAASHLGASASNRALTRLLNRLERRGGRGGASGESKGLFASLQVKLDALGDAFSIASLDLLEARLRPALGEARSAGQRLFEGIEAWLDRQGQATLRLTDALQRDPVWDDVLKEAMTGLVQALALLGDGVATIEQRLEKTGNVKDESLPALVMELRAVARRCESFVAAVRGALEPPPTAEPTVRWAELRGRAPSPSDMTVAGPVQGTTTTIQFDRSGTPIRRTVVLHSAPLDLAPLLREDLFGRAKSTVVTSATLTDAADFGFLLGRLGLDDDTLRVRTAQHPSPFDYAHHALLVVPSDTPAPNVDARAHLAHVVQHVADVATTSDGGLFVLATSHRDVRAIAAALRARADVADWPLLVHGEDGRDTLLRRFREHGRAILVGTATFWEGVDVPGDALRGLVIAKLPFRVPSEPVVAAHCEAIEARGGDAFAEYMLPHATLRLRQGVGRLIRTASDRGVIVLDDVRVVQKRYGRRMLDALPPARRLVASWGDARREVSSFYRRAR
jgi:ATP-dependent DNA helicase DinG